jgi:exonuclease III
VGDDANIKHSCAKQKNNNKNRNCYKVNQPNKGTVYFKIFHQNIRGLGKKAGELLSHLHPDFPHVLCLTEHHLKYLHLEKIHIENYDLGSHYCRQLYEKGGVVIFVHNSVGSSNIDIAQHCKEQDIEIRALKLSFGTLNIRVYVLALCIAPSGNISSFLLKLGAILQSLNAPKLQSIICGDTNINYINAFKSINEWLNTNLLSINFNKTQYVKFTTKNKPKSHIKITYNYNQISIISSIEFLGIYINDTINWKYRIEYILPKLSVACYTMRIIKPCMSLEMLKIVYYSNFNSVINYGLPFWGT